MLKGYIDTIKQVEHKIVQVIDKVDELHEIWVSSNNIDPEVEQLITDIKETSTEIKELVTGPISKVHEDLEILKKELKGLADRIKEII